MPYKGQGLGLAITLGNKKGQDTTHGTGSKDDTVQDNNVGE